MLSGKILLLAGAVALLPSATGQVAAQSADTASLPFTPPESPLVLTRTVWRTLSDGKEIMVRRRYAVQFTRRNDGFLLNGRLLDVAVEAPPLLAAMAELERNRSDEGLFPLMLDAAGRIRTVASAQPEPQPLRQNARAKAQGLIATTPLAPMQKREAGNFLTRLAAQGALAAWPADLFNPAPGERHEHRRISLPDGQEGEVNVSVKVLGANREGLPRSVERTVTTVLDGTARTSREQWTLAPASPPPR